MAKISIYPDGNDIKPFRTKFMWWKNGSKLNEAWQCNRPFFNIFTGYQVYRLMIGETIIVLDQFVKDNFTKIN